MQSALLLAPIRAGTYGLGPASLLVVFAAARGRTKPPPVSRTHLRSRRPSSTAYLARLARRAQINRPLALAKRPPRPYSNRPTRIPTPSRTITTARTPTARTDLNIFEQIKTPIPKITPEAEAYGRFLAKTHKTEPRKVEIEERNANRPPILSTMLALIDRSYAAGDIYREKMAQMQENVEDMLMSLKFGGANFEPVYIFDE